MLKFHTFSKPQFLDVTGYYVHDYTDNGWVIIWRYHITLFLKIILSNTNLNTICAMTVGVWVQIMCSHNISPIHFQTFCAIPKTFKTWKWSHWFSTFFKAFHTLIGTVGTLTQWHTYPFHVVYKAMLSVTHATGCNMSLHVIWPSIDRVEFMTYVSVVKQLHNHKMWFDSGSQYATRSYVA